MRKEVIADKIDAMIESGDLVLSEKDMILNLINKDSLEAMPDQKGYFAYQLERPGSIEDLVLKKLPLMELSDHQVEIEVRAFSLNFGDLLCVRGLYPTMPDYPFTPGFEVAGIVRGIGESVKTVSVGDPVIGLTGNLMGAHSTVLITEDYLVTRKPDNVSFEEAAAYPVVYMTMAAAFEKAGLRPKDTVLIQTAAGGTGLISIQFCQKYGANIIATAGSHEKIKHLKEMGITHCINYNEPGFEQKVFEYTNGRGVDLLINTLAGEWIQRGINVLSSQGRYVELAMTGLKNATNLSLSKLVSNQTFYSIDFRKMIMDQPETASYHLKRMSDDLASGEIKPTISKTFDFDQITDAYYYLEKRFNIGKVIVAIKDRTELSDHDQTTKLPTIGLEKADKEDIAVIGMSGRFPGADNLELFWANLVAGVDAVREIPEDRWDLENYYQSDSKQPDKICSKWGGFLDNIELFDAQFFNISGTEAEFSDPQQRIFLEESYRALENAGYANGILSGSRCGVFVGAGSGDYQLLMEKNNIYKQAHSFWGNSAAILSARIAYFLNLKGAAITVDTACSSSLVAIHLACNSLLNQETDVALAGGVYIANTPDFYLKSSNAGMLSKEGRCKAFDDSADGIVYGEGAGAVVLKRLSDAIRDHDYIYAVIKGSEINQDGKSNGITAPSSVSQTQLEKRCYYNANISPEDITYVETHGTGTKLGDPIEIEALTNAFREFTMRNNFCTVGSVKTNIGHTVAAAGIASFIKTVLCLKHKKIPGLVHYKNPNQHIDFDNSPFTINQHTIDWDAGEKQRLAAISSFGFSGTNCHMVLGEYQNNDNIRSLSLPSGTEPNIVAISAKSKQALEQVVHRLLELLAVKPTQSLVQLAYTLNVKRAHFSKRCCFVVNSLAELTVCLKQFLEERVLSAGDNRHLEAAQDCEEIIKMIKQGKISAEEKIIYYNELKRLYLSGDMIPFQLLYENEPVQTMLLPSYPYQRKPYWFLANSGSTGYQLDGAIDYGKSLDQNQLVFTVIIKRTDALVRDHIVNNHCIVPGVVHLEIIYLILNKINHGTDLEISQLIWINPLEVSLNQVQIEIVVRKHQLDYTFELQNAESQLVYSRGSLKSKISLLDTQFAGEEIETIKARCNLAVDDNQPYKKLELMGICYGEFYQALKTVWTGKNEALALVSLPEKYHKTFANYRLHPSIMDAAFQASTGIVGVKEDVTALPFSVGSLRKFRELEKEMYVHIVKDPDRPLEFNLSLINQNGEVCIQIDKLLFREREKQQEQAFYLQQWNLTEAVVSNRQNHNQNALIITDTKQHHLAQKLSSFHREAKILLQPADELEQCFTQFPQIQTIYYLIGNSSSDKGIYEDTNIINFFQFMKKLVTHYYSTEKLCIKVITEQIFDIGLDHLETINYNSSPISGFIKSLAKELIKWEFIHIDLNGRTPFDQSTKIVTRISNENRQEVIYRGQNTYIRELRPLVVPKLDQRSLIKENAVILIIGGAGGIGFEIAKSIQAKYGAIPILLGRSSVDQLENPELRELVQVKKSMAYFQTDCTDAVDFIKTVGSIKDKYHQINGIIHSAIVLDDKSFVNMSEESLRKVLNVKALPSSYITQYLKDEPLDFIIFFSSAQSFAGKPGQSNYSSACTFKDSYAAFLRKQVCCPVKVINWGFWGQVGIVCGDKYQTELTEQGLIPLTTELGIKIFDDFMRMDVDQVIGLKANPNTLLKEGFDLAHPLTYHSSDQQINIRDVLERCDYQTESLAELSLFESQFSEMEAFVTELMLHIVIPYLPGYRKGGADYKVLPKYDKLMEAMINILLKHQSLVDDLGKITVNPNTILKTDQELIDLRDRLPGGESRLKNHIALIWKCYQNYSDILEGRKSATEVIFPGTEVSYVEGIYRNNSMADFYNHLVTSHLSRFVAIADWGKKLRILEIGAGTGSTTEAVLQKVSTFATQISYCYTDISMAFVEYGKQKFGQRDFMEYFRLDIENITENDRAIFHTFDVVIATNVLHATKNIDNTLENVKKLMKDNGLLIINEATRAHYFTTLTFGLLDGWWLYEDEQNRIGFSPLLTVGKWMEAFQRKGFNASSTISSQYGESHDYGQDVLVAMPSRVNADTIQQMNQSKVQVTDIVSTIEKKKVAAVAEQKQSGQDVTNQIKSIFASVLSIHKEDLDDNAAFVQFGIDSLLSVTIVERLNKHFNILLNATDLFNYSCIVELAENIQGLLPIIQSVPDDEVSDVPETNSVVSVQSQPVVPHHPDDIAIIGMSGQFSSAETVEELWESMVGGKDLVREIGRWNLDDYYDDENKSYSKWGGFLNDPYQFDPLFFNITPKEAYSMDPQQRLFLQESWRAFEDAGLTEEQLKKVRCGVYVGCGSGDYNVLLRENDELSDSYGFMGNAQSILAARISYYLNLTGPSISIDTACSSSLVALALACDSLKSKDNELALVGGVSIMNTPEFYLFGSKAGMLSRTGRCRAFSDQADGFVPGEGCGAIILKRLDQAIEDHNEIYGVISGYGINQDGKTNGITAPNALSQRDLECEVYKKYQLMPDTISYIEAHGTGTKLGDPIEVQALTEAFRQYTDKKQFCAIGSVKANIGHTLASAGIASMIKVMLMMKYKEIPRSLHVDKTNQYIDFANSPFFVAESNQSWNPQNNQPRRAAISSFGFSGTNAHVVISEYQKADNPNKSDAKTVEIITVSAKSEQVLKSRLSKLLVWLRDNPKVSITDLAYTCNCCRNHYSSRAAFIATDLSELTQLIRSYMEEGPQHQFVVELSNDELINRLHSEISAETRRLLLNQLAQQYINHNIIVWSELYLKKDCQKIRIPAYPFELEVIKPKQNCVANNVTAGIRLLIDENSSTFSRQSFIKSLNGKEDYLSGHVINGEIIMPGAAMIEMALEAGSIAAEKTSTMISDLQFLQPLKITGNQQVEINLSPVDQSQARFEIGMNGNCYCIGRIGFDSMPDDNRTNILDTARAVRENVVSISTGEEIYNRFSQIGVQYGVSFKGIKQSFQNAKSEIFSVLESVLPDSDANYILYPATLDMIFQTIINSEIKTGALYLPFYIGRINIFALLNQIKYVFTRRVEVSDEEQSFDLYAFSDEEELLVEIINFRVKKINTNDDERILHLLKELRDKHLSIEEVAGELYGQI